MNWPILVYYSSAAITPAIALLALLIAYWNWRLAKDKWRLDLYERRFQTYDTVMNFIQLSLASTDATDAQRYKFINEAKRNEFLFKPEVVAYIDTLYKKSVRQMQLHRELEDIYAFPANSPQRSKLTDEVMEISDWIFKQLTDAKKLFGPYLRNYRH